MNDPGGQQDRRGAPMMQNCMKLVLTFILRSETVAVGVKHARKAIGRSAQLPQQRKRAAAQAFSVPAKRKEHGEQLADLRKKLGISQKILAQLTASSQRAVARWESGEKPGEMAKRALTELQRLCRSLSEVMKKDFIAEWLATPNPSFDDFKPLEIIERGEIDRIWRMIYDLEAGEAF
jgi:DNA-binding transcriptional regulator YiaG